MCVSDAVSSRPSSSSPALTVTVCAVSHVVPVNVSTPGARVTSSVAAPSTTATVTGALGSVARATVYVAVAFSSTDSAVGLTVSAGWSSSVTVTVTAVCVPVVSFRGEPAPQ